MHRTNYYQLSLLSRTPLSTFYLPQFQPPCFDYRCWSTRSQNSALPSSGASSEDSISCNWSIFHKSHISSLSSTSSWSISYFEYYGKQAHHSPTIWTCHPGEGKYESCIYDPCTGPQVFCIWLHPVTNSFLLNTCLPCLLTSLFHLWLTGVHHKVNMPFTYVYLISTLHSTCVCLKANTFPLPI